VEKLYLMILKYCVMQVNMSESTSQVEVEAEITLSASDVKDKYRVSTYSV